MCVRIHICKLNLQSAKLWFSLQIWSWIYIFVWKRINPTNESAIQADWNGSCWISIAVSEYSYKLIIHETRNCQMIIQLNTSFSLVTLFCSGVLCSLMCVRVYTRRPLPLWIPSTGWKCWKCCESNMQPMFTTKRTSWDLGTLWNDEWDRCMSTCNSCNSSFMRSVSNVLKKRVLLKSIAAESLNC